MSLPEIPKGEIITPLMYQRVCLPQHFMQKYQGFGISRSILNQLQREGIRFIRFIYQGKKGTYLYMATLRQYLHSKKVHTFNTTDEQFFVSVSEMIEV